MGTLTMQIEICIVLKKRSVKKEGDASVSLEARPFRDEWFTFFVS